jgi:hypothetical protein
MATRYGMLILVRWAISLSSTPCDSRTLRRSAPVNSVSASISRASSACIMSSSAAAAVLLRAGATEGCTSSG